MEVKEYISSGIIETCALGLCTPAEAAEVESMAAIHAEVKAELDAVRASLDGYAHAHAAVPSPGLKAKIMNALDNPENKTGGKIVPLPSAEDGRFSFGRVIAVAAGVLVLFSLGIQYYNLSKELERTKNEVARLNNEKSELVNSYNGIKANYIKSINDLAIRKDSMYKMVELKGLKPAPTAMVIVYWNAEKKDTYIQVKELPKAPSGMNYQFWAIVDGKPVDLGVMNEDADKYDTTGFHKMKEVSNPSAFAITLESQGGSTRPLGEMYVMGSI